MRRFSLVFFWLGAAMVFVAAWLVMWWIAPLWRNTPPTDFEGTIWALGGPVFMTIALAPPIGLILLAIGTFMHADPLGKRNRALAAFAAGTLVIMGSMLFPSTLGYFPVLFGIGGGAILVAFFATLLLWARNARELRGKARLAAELQLLCYFCFLLPALMACSLLGNPFSGLYFPERVTAYESLPVYYAMGTKMLAYFVLGFLFATASQYAAATARREEELTRHVEEATPDAHAA